MLFLLALLIGCTPDDSTPVELGRVAWQRDHDEAFLMSQKTEKPVLLFFQEVPG